MFFTFFASAGLNDPIYVILIILIVSGLMVYISNELFLGKFGTMQKMFMSYLIFFLTAFSFINTSVVTSFKGNIPTISVPQCPGPSDAPIIGALVNFVNWFLCGASYYTGILSTLFGISSTIQIVNTILIIPMLFIGIFLFLELVKP
jgi:hypothetical protein